MEQYKYNPSDYVDYLCESMTNFYAALPAANAIDLSCIWQRIFFDTKQAMKECCLPKTVMRCFSIMTI
mgnify:FL=1